MNVTVKDLLFWVRVKRGTKYWILVMHRVTGVVINEIQSTCKHNAYLNNYLRHPEYVLECCPTCEETRGYDNNTGECFFVFKLDIGCKIVRVCDGSFCWIRCIIEIRLGQRETVTTFKVRAKTFMRSS